MAGLYRCSDKFLIFAAETPLNAVVLNLTFAPVWFAVRGFYFSRLKRENPGDNVSFETLFLISIIRNYKQIKPIIYYKVIVYYKIMAIFVPTLKIWNNGNDSYRPHRHRSVFRAPCSYFPLY